MNRIAARAMAVLVLVLALAVGMGFFVWEYMGNARQWVMFTGSPHVYSEGKVGTGIVTDRDGVTLVDLTNGRTYHPDAAVRAATLHWTGDRQGNISVPYIDRYAENLVNYDPVQGLYTYGDFPGNVQLTLSARVQKAALEAMGDYAGTVAVYNYQTGELLCALSTPSFDPDDVPDIAGDTTGSYTGVYLNRFLRSKYIPGSIFKIVTLAAALETVEGITAMGFNCTGSYEIGGGDVTCMRAHGEQSLMDAFCNSCNCAFAEITRLVGKDTMSTYAERFGLTQSVSFDGHTGVAGNFDIAGASGEELAWSGIGQHKDQINPCAFLRFVGAVAGQGSAAQPYVVSSVTAGGKNTYTAKTETTQPMLSAETARLLREYMANNVESKYGSENFPGLTVCAKSGTGEVGGGQKPNAMFAGFVADPEYPLAFLVAIERGGFGADTCVPVISKVLEACVAEMDR